MAETAVGEHLDPTAELSLEAIKKKAVSGVLALTGRTFILQAVSLVATFLLTIFLSPSEFGTFFLVSAVINFFAYFSDIGLAAALIQKKEKLDDLELRTTFTVQQSLVFVLLLIIFAATPFLQKIYGLSQDASFLLWALGLSLFLSSLKTIPSVLLERRLEFRKLIIPQIVETILFNFVAVYLAWRGAGIASFTAAVLVRGISGLILIYIIQPWIPGLSFSAKALRGLLKFGLPYQANTLLAVIKDDGLTAVLGGILGTSGLGLLGWAQKWAAAPLRFFMDQVIKVTFPAFARLQDKKDELSKAVSKSMFFVCFLVFPALVGLVLLAPILTEIIPKYEKWQPALFALSLYAINVAWAAVTTPLTNLFSAIGKIKITFYLMTLWTVLSWALVPVLAITSGVSGAAAGYTIVGTTSIFAIVLAQRYVDFNFWGSVGKPFLAALIMGGVIYFLKAVAAPTLTWFFGLVGLGILIYSLTIYLLVGASLIADIRKTFYAIRKS